MFFGNYETRYYHRGQYRMAELLRNELARPAQAARAFETFVREYPFSKSWDDALFQLTELYIEAGRMDDARKAAARLAKERPESRYAARVQRLVETGRDPGPPPPWTDPTRPYDYGGAE
jgi:outer membrane protein assembly factor BamD (BamD/ComL family)